MADPMWTGGPEQFQDRYPTQWATFPDWMRDPLYPSDPPQSTFAMSITCLVLMAVPIIGYAAGPQLGEYQRYYASVYDSSPPGTHTDTPPDVTPPEPYIPVYGVDPTVMALLEDLQVRVLDCQNRLVSVRADTQLILDRLPQGEDPPPITTTNDTARILAAIYYTNWLWYNNPPPIDDADILAAITDAQNAIIGDVDSKAAAVTADVNGNTDLEVDDVLTAIGNIQSLSEATVQGIVNAAVGTLTGEIGEGTAAVLDGVETLLDAVGSDTRFPGLSGVTLGNPSTVGVASIVNGPMDGCLIEIESVPSGTGQHPVGGRASYLHMGWLAFVGPDGYCDEIQYLNLDTAAYVPKRVASGAQVIVFPRVGSSVTITPYTLA